MAHSLSGMPSAFSPARTVSVSSHSGHARPVAMREPGRDDRAAASPENVRDPLGNAPMQGDFLSVMEQNTANLAAAF